MAMNCYKWVQARDTEFSTNNPYVVAGVHTLTGVHTLARNEMRDKYDLWLEKIESGEGDPKHGERGYPGHYTSPFLLRSASHKTTFCFFIKEAGGKKTCFGTGLRRIWTNMSNFDVEIEKQDNELVEMVFLKVDFEKQISTSEKIFTTVDMEKRFKKWLASNNFVVTESEYSDDENQDLNCKLSETSA